MKSNKARIPVQTRGKETKTRIVDAGLALFARNGYHKTNAIGIAAYAGLATGTFYSYFNNKKEVLVEGIRRFYEQVTEIMVSATLVRNHSISTAEDFIRYMIRTLFTAHDIDPNLHREISAMFLLDKDIENACMVEDMKVVKMIRLFLESHRDFLRITDYEAAAMTILRVSNEMVQRIKIYPSFMETQIDKDRMIRELEDMLCLYLLKETRDSGNQ